MESESFFCNSTFEDRQTAFTDSPALMSGQQFDSVLACADPYSFQFINASHLSIIGTNTAVGSLVNSRVSGFGGDFHNTNYTYGLGEVESNAWPLQMQFAEPNGSYMHDGLSVPLWFSPTTVSYQSCLDEFTRVSPDGTIIEGRSSSNKRSKAGSTGSGNDTGECRSRQSTRNSHDAEVLSPEEAKRKKLLRCNRVAATKCRQKKREWINTQKEKARELAAQRQALTACVAMLKKELFILKCKCLEHSDCQCQRIREYIQTSVLSFPPAFSACMTASPAM